MAKQQASPKSVFFAGLACLLGALVCIALIVAGRARIADWETTEGVVVRVERRRGTSGSSNLTIMPVARFSTAAGTEVEHELLQSRNSPFCCEEGETVALRYPTGRPAEVLVDRFSEQHGPHAAFGAVLALFGVILTVSGRRRMRTAA